MHFDGTTTLQGKEMGEEKKIELTPHQQQFLNLFHRMGLLTRDLNQIIPDNDLEKATIIQKATELGMWFRLWYEGTKPLDAIKKELEKKDEDQKETD